MAIGVMGGTFDPIHYGHLILAEQAREQLDLDRVLFVTACGSAHKSGQALTDAKFRHEMVCMAVEGNARFVPSTLELDRGGVSYTIDTVRQILADNEQGTRVYLLVGADEAAEPYVLADPYGLQQLATVVVANRPCCEDALSVLPEDFARGLTRLRMPSVDISSTDLRERVRSGRSIRYLVPECVESYIRQKGLYIGGN